MRWSLYGASQEKQRHTYEQLGLEPPEELRKPSAPRITPALLSVITAYGVIRRARTYTAMGAPLPITITDVNAYVNAHPPAMLRTEFDAAIFAMDDLTVEQILKVMSDD